MSARGAAWLGGALATLPWLLTSAPGAGFYDAGELAAAATEPGVPHPTGFALLLLLGQLAQALPFGTLAGKIHAIGAAAGVAAAALWWWAGQRDSGGAAGPPMETEHRPAWTLMTTAAAALIAVSPPPLALHLRQAEVYPLLLLHAAAGLWLLLGRRGPVRLIGAGLLLGLACGVHAEAIVLAAAIGTYGLLSGDAGGRGQRLRACLGAAAAVVAGALCVVALPLVASRRPLLDWGGVDSATALFNHVSAASIRAAFADQIGAAPLTAARQLTLMMAAEAWPWLVAGALTAVAALHASAGQARRRLVAATLALALIDIGWAVFINPMGVRDGQVGLIALLAFGVLAGDGVVQVARAAARRGGMGRALAVAGLGAVAAAALYGSLAVLPTAALEGAARHADAMLDPLPPAALAIVAHDHTASACLWLQAAEGARPDVRCLPGVFARDARMLRRMGLRLQDAPMLASATLLAAAKDSRGRAAALGALLRPAAAAGVLRWEPGLVFEDAQVAGALRPGWPFGAVALLPQPLTATVADAEAAVEAMTRACRGWGERCAEGSPLQRHLASLQALWATWLLPRAPAPAAALLERAVMAGAGGAQPLHNLALARLGQGRAAEALGLAERALALEPGYLPAHRSASRAALQLGQADLALQHASASGTDANWLRGLSDAARSGGQMALAAELEALAGERDARRPGP